MTNLVNLDKQTDEGIARSGRYEGRCFPRVSSKNRGTGPASGVQCSDDNVVDSKNTCKQTHRMELSQTWPSNCNLKHRCCTRGHCPSMSKQAESQQAQPARLPGSSRGSLRGKAQLYGRHPVDTNRRERTIHPGRGIVQKKPLIVAARGQNDGLE